MSQAAIHSELLRRPWQVWGFIVAFALLIAGFVASNLIALHDGKLEKTQEQGWNGFSQGKPMQALATDLRRTPLADWTGARQRELGWLLFDDLGPRVREGCSGWLFLMDELKSYPMARENAETRARTVIAIHHALHERGSRLIVALVPDKTRIEQDRLCDLPRPRSLEARSQSWLNLLRANGVETIDLAPPLREIKQRDGAAFDRTDTHWTLAGAEASAHAIAERMHAMGHTPAAPLRFERSREETRPRWGDLVRLAGLDTLPEALRPEPDQVAPYRFAAMPADTATSAADLFGDTANDRVTLVGTSFSRNAQFSDFLADSLTSEVGNLAKDGGGFAQSMSDFIKKELHTGEGTPPWVIWEIPERVLQEPLGDPDHALRIPPWADETTRHDK
ncbi:MAG: alginate O-acetyltransferase AlgX-related protein [Pseudomonadota bacterium]